MQTCNVFPDGLDRLCKFNSPVTTQTILDASWEEQPHSHFGDKFIGKVLGMFKQNSPQTKLLLTTFYLAEVTPLLKSYKGVHDMSACKTDHERVQFLAAFEAYEREAVLKSIEAVKNSRAARKQEKLLARNSMISQMENTLVCNAQGTVVPPEVCVHFASAGAAVPIS